MVRCVIFAPFTRICPDRRAEESRISPLDFRERRPSIAYVLNEIVEPFTGVEVVHPLFPHPGFAAGLDVGGRSCPGPHEIVEAAIDDVGSCLALGEVCAYGIHLRSVAPVTIGGNRVGQGSRVHPDD